MRDRPNCDGPLATLSGEDAGLNPAFWRGKTVLLTGHTGFKGGWLALLLSRLGAKVTGYALAPDGERSLFAAAGLSAHIDSTIADIRDGATLVSRATTCDPQIIFHLAAQALVLPSYRAPLDTFSTNVIGTAHLLEAARSLPRLQAIVVVTSDKVYDNREEIGAYRESDALGGRDPYSASKACAEIVTAAYRASFFGDKGVGIATGRAGNAIGGGDWARERIVPDFVRATLEGRPLVVRNPTSTRPWQHVLESLSGYVRLAERLGSDRTAAEGPWNFGPAADAVQPVSALADALVDRWGNGANWKPASAEQPYEARSLTLDSSKAGRQLGWRRRLGFSDSVCWTVDWYKAFIRGEDMQAVTLAQIDRYLSLAS